MTILWKELKKITRQAQAKENIFGYKSTEANQLFLLHCFTGKIFFTDKIRPQVKYLWYSTHAFEMLVCYFAVLSNLWYGFQKDLMAMFDIMNVLGICNMIVFGYPLVSYRFRTRIDSLIEGVDEICTLRSSSHCKKYKNVINIKKVLLLNLSFYCLPLVMSFMYLFDVMLFFEKQKLENRYYYALSVPLIESHRSNLTYFVFNCLMNVVFTQMCMQCLLFISLILYWGTTCNNALICAAKELDKILNMLNSSANLPNTNYDTWNQDFNNVLIRNIKFFQKITRIIDDFRGIYEVICTIVVPAAFFVAVAQLHLTISANLSLILKLKSLAVCLTCIWPILLLYWTAEKVENSVSELSLAIYSTPWYESVQPRRVVYIFLCQTQTFKNIKIVKVYPLSLSNFSRYLNGIWSYTTTLLTLTQGS